VQHNLRVFLQKQTKQIALKENAGYHHSENSVLIVLKYALPAASPSAVLFKQFYCNIQRLYFGIKLAEESHYLVLDKTLRLIL
jgi:hypothetical protein